MIDFTPIKAEHFSAASRILKSSGIENSDHCFATKFVWSYRHPIDIAVIEDTVFMRSIGIQHRWYMYPRGSMDMTTAIKLILEDADTIGMKRSIYGIDRKGAQFLKQNFSDILDIKEDRDGSDYLYNSQDLINLPGKNYQKKRNHCSRFERENPDYKFMLITPENTELAKQFETSWCKKYECGLDKSLSREQKGIMELLDNFDKMDLMGAMIETNGQIVAMSVAAPINENMVDVIVEKAYHDINGAYAIINREFAKHCFADFEYINREDDMGFENLRKAKLSYFPREIRQKFLAQSR